MKEVVLQPINERVVIKTDTRVLDTLLARECRVAMACGGNGICATCHVYVVQGMSSLSPMGERERSTLGGITGANANSRLSCQCRVLGEGVEVMLPEGMYVLSMGQLENLIGQEAKVPILHPQDGRVLIRKGKVISRSRIMELQGTNFNLRTVV